MQEVAESKNLYDWQIETYKDSLLKIINIYEFLDNIAYYQKSYQHTREYSNKHKKFAVFVSKKMKVKLNTEFYQNDRQPETTDQEEEVELDSN